MCIRSIIYIIKSLSLSNYLRDDEAEPDDEDDAEGEGDCGQPAGQAHAQVQAANPLGPRAARKQERNRIEAVYLER